MYKVRDGIKGRKLYFHDGKMISIQDVPDEVLYELQFTDQVEERHLEPPRFNKPCLACDKEGKYERIVHMQTIVLCNEHYYSLNIGKIAQLLKEKSGEKQEAQEVVHQA